MLGNSSEFITAVGTVATGAIMGGIGAEISGGNFWDGFRNGAISSGLNHVAHIVQNRLELDAFARRTFGRDYKTKYGVTS